MRAAALRLRIVVDPVAAARVGGLRYVSDRRPGIRRRRAGAGFVYLDARGRPVRNAAVLRRIRALVIPPAWQDVWICPLANGHLQATGRDARGRKQFRYHARWRQVRDETKYARMIAFAAALPRIRTRVQEDLARPGLPREKVLATVVRLLESTFIRVGNAEYARDNESYGLTTLRDRHVRVDGPQLHFRFRGKSGKEQTVRISDRRLARIVRRCRDLPGQDLFQYIGDDGVQRAVGSSDVNAYLREIAGEDFTAKDFRTWAGTVLAALALQACARADSPALAKRHIVQAIQETAKQLGNTPAVCRKCYVHPAVLEAYLDGVTLTPASGAPPTGLHPEEAAVLVLLRTRLT